MAKKKGQAEHKQESSPIDDKLLSQSNINQQPQAPEPPIPNIQHDTSAFMSFTAVRRTSQVLEEDYSKWVWGVLLTKVKDLARGSGAKAPKIFISYAWYTDGEKTAKLQHWLSDLKKDLERAGAEKVFLDIANMDGDMDKKMREGIDESDFYLIIGTPRYLERVANPNTNASFELAHILEKAKTNPYAIKPLLVEGEFAKSFPDSLLKYLIRDFREPSQYRQQLIGLVNPLGLIPAIYNINEGNAEYEELLKSWRISQLTNVPYLNRNNLIERTELLTKLDNQLSTVSSSAITQQQTISGLGGIGKTQLTLYFAHQRMRQGCYKFIRWINADVNSLELSVKTFAADLGVDIKGMELKAVQTALRRQLQNIPTWLIVFDNAENFEQLKDYLPQTQQAMQHILITSRSRNWENTLDVSLFSPDEATQYIQKILPKTSEADCLALAKELGFLPLAINYAVAYIKQFSGMLSISSYLDNYKKKGLALLTKNSLAVEAKKDVGHTVLTVWEMSMEKIRSLSPEAAPLLMYCGYLAPDNIPIKLLQALFDDELKCLEAIALLQRNYSMLDTVGKTGVKVHRLLQEVIREQDLKQPNVNVAEQRLIPIKTAIKEKGIYIEDKITQEDFDFTRVLIPHLQALIEHLTPFSEVVTGQENHAALAQAYLLGITGTALSDLGDYAGDKVMLERALKIKEKHYGCDHPQTAITLGNLGNTLSNLGDYAGAKVMLERALKIQETHYGPAHPDVALTLGNLGTILNNLGDYAGAKALHELVLKIFEKHYGSDHPEVARAITNLGRALNSLGDYAGAKVMLERALKIKEKHYGCDHPQTAITLGNLGNTLSDLGDYAGAKVLYERALKIKEKHYGCDHPKTALALGNLGDALSSLGDNAGAKVLYERALKIEEKHYGSDHSEVATTLENLGTALSDLGDYAGAKVMLERTLKIKEKHYGCDHPQTALALGNLGDALYSFGDYAGAKALYERALKIFETHYGSDHPEVARTLVNLGAALHSLGDYAEAKLKYERALKIEEKHYGSDHPKVATTLGNLGNALFSLGDYAGAKLLRERVLKIDEKHYGPDHQELTTDLMNLGNALGSLGDYAGAKALYERALKIDEKHYGLDHPKVASNLFILGIVLHELGDKTESKNILIRAYKNVINYPGFGKEHPLALQILAIMKKNGITPEFTQVTNTMKEIGIFQTAKTTQAAQLPENVERKADTCCMLL